MFSVTHRIKDIKQPRGGYLNVKTFSKMELNYKNALFPFEEENIHATLSGLAVDYLTRFIITNNKENAFHISMTGASIIYQDDLATNLLNKICGLDDESIICACKLVGFDVCLRNSPMAYTGIDKIEPNSKTIHNIRSMVERAVNFINIYGPIVESEITFEGAYTKLVSSGDGDFITNNTIWDFKTTKNNITSKHTLQLLTYFVMSKHSNNNNFRNLKNIGFYNPRKDEVYILDCSSISPELIKFVENDVIGYNGNDEIILNELFGQVRLKQMEEFRERVRKNKERNAQNTPCKELIEREKKYYDDKSIYYGYVDKVKAFLTSDGRSLIFESSISSKEDILNWALSVESEFSIRINTDIHKEFDRYSHHIEHKKNNALIDESDYSKEMIRISNIVYENIQSDVIIALAYKYFGDKIKTYR